MKENIKTISIRLLWVLFIAGVIEITSIAFDLMNQSDTYTFWAGALIVVSLWSMTAALLIYQITEIVNKYKSNK
jgi:hypothetical protein